MFDETDIVFSYTRAQAIADGVLVDVSERAREAGFRIPVALTAAVWADAVSWNEADEKRAREYQDESGRLWDVLHMACIAAGQSRNADRVAFTVFRAPRSGGKARPLKLAMLIGGGDHREPVITIMLPNED